MHGTGGKRSVDPAGGRRSRHAHVASPCADPDPPTLHARHPGPGLGHSDPRAGDHSPARAAGPALCEALQASPRRGGARHGARLLHVTPSGEGLGADRSHRGEEPTRSRGVRIVVLGGTRFIGRAAVEELAAAGHELLIVHRGHLVPDGMPDVRHLHCERAQLEAHNRELDAFEPQAVVDCRALTRADAEIAMRALPDVRLRIVISSIDVYRAFGALNDERETDPVPLDEESPVRPERYPYRGRIPGMDDYDKLDVEDVYVPRGATVLRLPMVYGEHDYQLREEFILRRIRAGRARIPFGAGMWLAGPGYVRDVGGAVRLALRKPVAAQVMNICEDRSYSMRRRSRMILDAAESDAELVRVSDEALPEDLKLTGTVLQHIAASAAKARRLLGWSTSDPVETLGTTVRWHLQNPPAKSDTDFTADDRALEAAPTSV